MVNMGPSLARTIPYRLVRLVSLMALGQDPKTARSTAIWLAIFFVAAFTLRIAFSLGVGYDEGTERYIFTGNDPYYHDRSLRHLLETGRNLDFDSGINYPEGRDNPNPPLFVWTAAPLAVALQAGGTEDPTGLALNIMTAFWGALTVIAVFMLASDLFSRKAGLWAGFFTAVSGPHIQRTVAGYADHDGITMVLITFAFAFLVRALRGLQNREYVSSWRNAAARLAGIKLAYTANKRSFQYATLAGLSLTATALVWKGYPYALAVLAVAVGFQLLADHLRNRDSTALFGVYVTALVLVVVLPYLLYYIRFPSFLGGTIYPSLYVLIGVLVAGLILIPTRDVPSVVVFPGLLVAGLGGIALLIWVFPTAGYQIFSGLGYFSQSKLYTTIAEAQRAELGFVAASFGFFTFLLGFWGFGKALKGAWKGDAAFMLLASWAVVAFFMAFAASRFIMNAVPVFAILIGASMVSILAWLGTADVARRFRATHGQGITTRAAKSLTWKSGLGVTLVALFLILPNVWIGVDAATSSEFEQKHGLVDNNRDTTARFGAFGISFDLRDNGWIPTMDHLAQLDQDLPEAQRPAFIGWWDYGHWAIALGKHPTVADPFQDHFELAGRFLASETEEEAMSWLTILLLDYDWNKNGGQFSPAVQQALVSVNSTLASYNAGGTYDADYAALAPALHGDDAFTLYDKVMEATGKNVGYMAVDIRMFPFGASQSGIFYAPVYLANKNPDDFLPTYYPDQSGRPALQVKIYGVDEDGNSYRLKTPQYVDSTGVEWVVYNGYAYRPGQTPLQGAQIESGISLLQEAQLQPTQRFVDSMFVRAYGSYQGDSPSGDRLSHWRVIQQSVDNYFGIPDAKQVVLLQYYKGVQVSGTVTDESGAPMAGVQVAFVDGYGGSHDVATTGADGSYSIIAPPSQNGDLNLTVRQGTQVLFERTDVQFTQEEAAAGGSRTGVDVVVSNGDLSGVTFDDLDGDNAFNATRDTALAGVQVSFGGKTTTSGSDGRYTLSDVTPGAGTITATKAGYTNGTAQVTVKGGQASVQDVALEVKSSLVTLRFEDNGQGVSAIPISITGAATRSVTTNTTGHAVTTLAPGDYTARIDYNATINGVAQRYQGTASFNVPFGGEPMAVVITRQA